MFLVLQRGTKRQQLQQTVKEKSVVFLAKEEALKGHLNHRF